MASGNYYAIDWSRYFNYPAFDSFYTWDTYSKYKQLKKESEVFYIVAYLDAAKAGMVQSITRFTSEADAQAFAEKEAYATRRDYFVLKTITKLTPPKVQVTKL